MGVVAVQTQAKKALLDFQCNSQMMSFDSRNAGRAVIAALLQTVWGVGPTHHYWDPDSAMERDNYMWSVGPTPFGPFSPSMAVSFVQADAAARISLYSHIHKMILRLAALVSMFEPYGRELDHVLSPKQHQLFIRRWNVLVYKMHKATEYLSLCNFNHSLYFVLSMQHDVKDMEHIVHTAGAHLHSYMHCFTGQSSSHWTMLMLAVVALLGWYWHSSSRGQSQPLKKL